MDWSFPQVVRQIETWSNSESTPSLFIAVCEFESANLQAAGFVDEFMIFDSGEVGFRFVWDGGALVFRFTEKAAFDFSEPGLAPESLNVPEGQSLALTLQIRSESGATCVLCEPCKKVSDSESDSESELLVM